MSESIPPTLHSLFLRLPKSIRADFFRHAGLARTYPLSFTDDPRQQYPWDYYYIPIPLALLLVNHQVSTEAMQILYGENTFRLECLDRNARRYLKNLRPKTLTRLRFLQVSIINQPVYYDLEGHARSSIRDLPTNHDKDVELAWLDLFPVLRSDSFCHAKLDLTINLAIDNGSMAEKILSDLADLLKVQCIRVRLDEKSPLTFSEYSQVMRSMGKLRQEWQSVPHMSESSPSVFPFERLPVELQFMILSHTDLLNRTRRILLGNRQPLFIPSRDCCVACNKSGRSCYCNIDPSIFSSTCVCWKDTFARSIFLLNKRLNLEANKTFFRKNQFSIRDCSLHTIAILNRMPIHSLAAIQDLVLNWEFHSPHEFRKLINFLHGKAHPRLWLKLALSQYVERLKTSFPVDSFLGHLHEKTTEHGFGKITFLMRDNVARNFAPSNVFDKAEFKDASKIMGRPFESWGGVCEFRAIAGYGSFQSITRNIAWGSVPGMS